MARFPKIDSPCPLDAEAQRRIDGHCGHCNKTVHSLDGMSDAERIAFMRSAAGPICVRYSQPARPTVRAGRFGWAIAATLVTSPVFAREAPVQQTPVGTSAAVAVPTDTPALEQIMVGGISDPADAGWTDDGSKPELPVASDDAQTSALDRFEVIGGGIRSPADAEWIDKDTAPELPITDAEGSAGR